MREAHGNYDSSTTLLRFIIEAHAFCGLMTEHKLSGIIWYYLVLFGIKLSGIIWEDCANAYYRAFLFAVSFS